MNKKNKKISQVSQEKKCSKEITELIEKVQKTKSMSSDEEFLIKQLISSSIDDKKEKISIPNLFSDQLWRVAFTKQFLEKWQDSKQYFSNILQQILLISNGIFRKNSLNLSTKLIFLPQLEQFQQYFSSTNPEKIALLFEVGIIRQPQFENNKFISFNYDHSIIFFDLIFLKKNEDISFLAFEYQFHKQPSVLPEKLQEIEVNFQSIRENKADQLFKWNSDQNWSVEQFTLKQQLELTWYPNKFEVQNILKNQEYHLYDSDFLHFQEHRKKQLQLINGQISQQNRILIDQYLTTYNFETIRSILCNFLQKQKILITEQEEDVINTSTNTLVIGRSGTGKTTCIILRIIALQLVIGLEEKTCNGQGGLSRQLSLAMFGEEAKKSGLSVVFTSQNPLLVNEMRRYYNKLLNNCKIQFKKIQLDQSENQNEIEKLIYNHLSDLSLNEEWSIDFKSSLLETTSDDYPILVSFNSLLLLLDNSLQNSFFSSKKFSQPKKAEAGWKTNIGNSGQFFQSQIQEEKNNSTYQQYLLQEVDYELFSNQFWIQLRKKYGNIYEEASFCSFVWGQIYSIIKGSQFSHTYPNRYLPLQIYLNFQQQQKTDEKTLAKVYSYFLLYEKWKEQQSKFDQMDLVNHIILEFKNYNYLGQNIHYLFVDEVQDFTQATLQLFILLAEQRIMLSGDTAQNIVKGVGFRFQDLKNQFFGVKEFSTFHLTTNFRSHNNILQLANNIVSIIEQLFPKTIDSLKKEESNVTGPKPTIIASKDINQIIFLLQGQNDGKTLEFGCYQAVLTKMNDDVPEILKHLIVLNIQECKGLEFDDVVLYNFFDDDSVPYQQWELLKQFLIEQIDGSQKLKLKPSIQTIDLNLFTLICNELKYLYVAVTRARKRIFIYDDNPYKRAIIEQLWDQLGLVTIITFDENIEKMSGNNSLLLSKNSKAEWQEQGIKMFQMKFYEQASKCFKYSGDVALENQASGFALATLAQKCLFDLDTTTQSSKYVKTKKHEKVISKQQAFQLFIQAGNKFSACYQLEQAAACFFSGKDYQLALKYYLQSLSWENAVVAAEKIDNFLVAGILQWKCKNYEKCLNIFEQLGNPIFFLVVLKHLQQYVDIKLYKTKICQWLPLLFKSLTKPNPKYLILNFDICQDNIENFNLEFKEILEVLFSSIEIPLNEGDLLEIIFYYVTQFQEEILNLMEQIHINYNRQLFQQIFENSGATSINFIRIKIQLLQDIFSYFKLDELSLLLFDKYNIIDRTKHVVNLLFQFSTFTNSKAIDFFPQTKQLIDNTPCNWNSKNYLQPIFQMCQLGLFESAKHLIEQLIRQPQVSKDQIMYYNEDFDEISYQYFSEQKQQSLGLIISKVDQFYRDQNNNNLALQPEYALIYSVLNKIESKKVLDESEMESIFKHLDPNTIQASANQVNTSILVSSINLLKIITLVEDHPVIKQFDQLNHKNYQHFLRFIQVCIELFKYNQDITSQVICFLSICCVFSIRVPQKLTLNQLSQTVVFVHRDSILFRQNYIQTKSGHAIDTNQNIWLYNSKEIFDIIRNQLRKFQQKYSQRYLLMEQNKISKAPFLVQHYTYLRLKKIQEVSVPEGIKKYELYKEVYYDFFLEKCLKVQIIDSLYSMTSQCAEPKLIITKRMLSELAMYYFFKGLSESAIELMHNNIMIGISIQNIAHEQNMSLRFIEHLLSVNSKFEEAKFYNDYINYLQMTNFCYSLDSCTLYFKFHNQLKKLLSPEQILKDLTFITLILTSYSIALNQQAIILVPDSSLKLIQHNLISDNLYEIQIKLQAEELIFVQTQQLLVEAIFEQIKVNRSYNKYLRLIASLLLNITDLWEGLSDRLYAMAEELEYESDDQDFQLLAELALKSREERRDYLYPFKKFKEVQIKFLITEEEQVQNYLTLKYKRRAIEAHFLDKMNYQYQESLKNKFPNYYFGMRLILFRPLNITNGQITEKSIEDKTIGKLYEKIDFLRRLLISTLYSKIVVNSSHFSAITNELKLLSNLELDVDYYISKNERKLSKKVIEPDILLKELQQIQEQIENWKKMNQELNDNINSLQYSFQAQQEEESKALELLLSRVLQILQ